MVQSNFISLTSFRAIVVPLIYFISFAVVILFTEESHSPVVENHGHVHLRRIKILKVEMKFGMRELKISEKNHIFDLRHLFAVDLNINTLAARPDHSKLPKSAI